jgi:hypothetical protein
MFCHHECVAGITAAMCAALHRIHGVIERRDGAFIDHRFARYASHDFILPFGGNTGFLSNRIPCNGDNAHGCLLRESPDGRASRSIWRVIWHVFMGTLCFVRWTNWRRPVFQTGLSPLYLISRIIAPTYLYLIAVFPFVVESKELLIVFMNIKRQGCRAR